MTRVLEVEDLSVSFQTESGRLTAVDHVSFHLNKGETVGLVGESGSGKSVTSLALMRLLPQPWGNIDRGKIILHDGEVTTEIQSVKAPSLGKIRGRKMGMIFQEPMTALNPVQRVGVQLAEVFDLHFPNYSEQVRREKSVELMEKVGIPSPEKRLNAYPHELSGGMRQRVVIAMAVAAMPLVLIADEPTTALDVTIQAQILDLLRELQVEIGMSLFFITHDLGVVADFCDRVLVMYAGRIVESGRVLDIFQNPSHPYTRGLLSSIPRIDTEPKTRLSTIEGMVPTLAEMPSACRFANRCRMATEVCKQTQPKMRLISEGHMAACHHLENQDGA